jgi:hypothetical protein
VTADLCAAVPANALSQWGTPSVHVYQSAGRCYYDVQLDGRRAVQLELTTVPAAKFDLTLAKPAAHDGPFRFDPVDGSCERAFRIGAEVFDIRAYINQGKVSDDVLCATAEAAMLGERTSLTSHRPPRRSVASPSLTRFDLCSLITDAHLGRVPELADLDTPYRADDGGGCDADTGSLILDVVVAFTADNWRPRGSLVHYHGHALRRTSSPQTSSCEIMSQRGNTRDGAGREQFDVQLSSETSIDPSHLCELAEQATGAMLDTVNLK